MAEPTLIQVFGATADITGGVLSITLDELPGTLGATPSAEAIVAAISIAAEAVQDTEVTADMTITKVARAEVTRGTVLYTRYRYQHDYFVPFSDLDPGVL